MEYVLWKKIESFGKGTPEDGSESWTSKTSYQVVADEDADEYAESQASCCGDQDYSYRVAFKEIEIFDDLDELLEVKEALEVKLK